MSIGILTSGGDCPGLNAVIRAAVLKGTAVHGLDFVGIKNGWKGIVEGDLMELGRPQVVGISKQGGTILGTSRTNPFEGGGPERVAEVMKESGMEAIIAIGGEGTLAAAMPECRAIQPTWRPMTSATMQRWCESPVVRRRSIASVAMLTAVSKPKE